MKKVIYRIAMASLLICLLSGCSLVYGRANIMKTLPSPNGKHVAYVFESSGGATSGFIYHISVVRKGAPQPRRGPGNVLVATTSSFDIEWVNNDQLHVHNYRSIYIFKQKERASGVRITYDYLND